MNGKDVGFYSSGQWVTWRMSSQHLWHSSFQQTWIINLHNPPSGYVSVRCSTNLTLAQMWSESFYSESKMNKITVCNMENCNMYHHPILTPVTTPQSLSRKSSNASIKACTSFLNNWFTKPLHFTQQTQPGRNRSKDLPPTNWMANSCTALFHTLYKNDQCSSNHKLFADFLVSYES